MMLGSSGIVAVVGWLAFSSGFARASEIETSIPDFSLRWDNTVTTDELFRTETLDKTQLANNNDDDAPRNFRGSLAAARQDLYSEIDVKYGDFGARGSASGWEDFVYDFHNTNNSAGTLNSIVDDNRTFQRGSQQIAGNHAELNDLFTYGSFAFGNGRQLSYRVGQFVQIWGESLLFAGNGIGGGMNPVDGIKGQLLLNAQARDVYLPTPQISVTYNIQTGLSVSSYYKLGWRSYRTSPIGTYFGASDVVDLGADKLFVTEGQNAPYFRRSQDIKPSSGDGEFGLNVRYRLGEYDLGLYFVRYNWTTPGDIYLHPGINADSATGQLGTYQQVYPKGVQIYGASASTNVIDVINLAGEVSVRRNEPLLSVPAAVGLDAGSGNNIGFPRGDVAHAQLSVVYASPPIHFIRSNQLALTGEVAGNHLLQCYSNCDLRQGAGTTNTAVSSYFILTASYLNLFPDVDVTPSVGWSYNFYGSSPVISGPAHSGTINFSVKALYSGRYTLTGEYQHYYGNHSNDPAEIVYNNPFLGRDFAGIAFTTTF